MFVVYFENNNYHISWAETKEEAITEAREKYPGLKITGVSIKNP